MECLASIPLSPRALGYWDSVPQFLHRNHLLDGVEGLRGGQQQRVAIARAMVNKPEIIFADEPTANLDSTSGRQVMEALRWLNKQFGTTILFVSHDEDDQKYANRVVHLYDGKISEGMEETNA